MSDVLTVPDDDLFWPPTDRTEAESPDIASKTDAWIFAYLGSRVRSFSPAPDRVIVWCMALPTVDAFALPAATRAHADVYAPWRVLARCWEPYLTTYLAFAEVNTPAIETVLHRLNPAAEPELAAGPDAGSPQPNLELDRAVVTVKRLLGLTDEQLEAATGISRSTLWRLRTGRTGEARSLTEAPIWRLYGVVRAIAERLGADGVRTWFHAGTPAPAGLLAAGDLVNFEQAADRVLFSDHSTSRTAAAASEDDYSPVIPHAATAGPTKRPRPVRKPGDRSS